MLTRPLIAIHYPLTENPQCEVCHKSIDIDSGLYHQFKVYVCRPCKLKDPDTFRLVTKTDVKEASPPLSIATQLRQSHNKAQCLHSRFIYYQMMI